MGYITIFLSGLVITINISSVLPQFPFFKIVSYDVPTLGDIGDLGDCYYRCPRIYLPICADDNVTYINECRMHCINQAKVWHNETPASFVKTGPCKMLPEEENYNYD